jgi:hypothetical protein
MVAVQRIIGIRLVISNTLNEKDQIEALAFVVPQSSLRKI